MQLPGIAPGRAIYWHLAGFLPPTVAAPRFAALADNKCKSVIKVKLPIVNGRGCVVSFVKLSVEKRSHFSFFFRFISPESCKRKGKGRGTVIAHGSYLNLLLLAEDLDWYFVCQEIIGDDIGYVVLFGLVEEHLHHDFVDIGCW